MSGAANLSSNLSFDGTLNAGLWLIIIGMAFVTILNRAGLMLLSGRFTLPPWLQRALRYAPCAALAAISLPDLLMVGGHLNVSLDNLRLYAGAIGLIVALTLRSTILTLAVGMASLHLLRFAFQ